jgi:hypothetical protein
MRDFSAQFLDDYIAAKGVPILSSVGCYHFEGRGAQLFDRVEGDYFSVLGLRCWRSWQRCAKEGILAVMTRKAGIVGWPVAHSLSPVLHGYWLEKYRIDGAFERIPAEPGKFAAGDRRSARQGFSGVNVTVPHKEAAFALAKTRCHAPRSQRGAANLLIFPDKAH